MRGVAAGASSPKCSMASKPGSPDSATVGTSGSRLVRVALVTAIGRRLPD